MLSFKFILPLLAVEAIALAGPCFAADTLLWGAPVAGLRVGIRCRTTTLYPHQQPDFEVRVQNVSGHSLIIPAPSAYMNRQHPWMIHYRAQPLSPEITQMDGTIVRSSSMESGSDRLRTLTKSVVTLPPAHSLTLRHVALTFSFYTPEPRSFLSGTAGLETWWLHAMARYRVRYAFQNEEGTLAGKRIWTGKAISGTEILRVVPAPTAHFAIAASFSVPKTEYFVGEPIRVTFHVKNGGKETIRFQEFGDFGGMGRNERFSFSAVDDNGHPVPPVVTTPSMGGPGGQEELQPGASFSETLLVNSWLLFRDPGTYTITCSRTLNMDIRTAGYAPEEALPAVPVGTKLAITLRQDEAALRGYFNNLLIRLDSNYLKGSTDEVRIDAHNQAVMEVQALAVTHPESLFPLIKDLLQAPGPNQAIAAGLISSYGQERAIGPLLQASKTGSPAVRYRIMPILAEWKRPEAGPLVSEALQSPDVQKREVASMLCSKTPYPECLPTLLGMVSDPDSLVRLYLAGALAGYKGPEVTAALLRLLHDPDPNGEVPAWAAISLGPERTKESIPVLLHLLDVKTAARFRESIYYTLQRLSGKKLAHEPQVWKKWWEWSQRSKS